jgi:hypothetical protein
LTFIRAWLVGKTLPLMVTLVPPAVVPVVVPRLLSDGAVAVL